MSGAGRGQCEVLESNPFAHGGKAWRWVALQGKLFNSDGVFTNATFLFGRSGWKFYCTWSYEIIYSYGYGSIPINTIFSGMNIHLPAILMFTRGTRFWHTAISIQIDLDCICFFIPICRLQMYTWESMLKFGHFLPVYRSTPQFWTSQSLCLLAYPLVNKQFAIENGDL